MDVAHLNFSHGSNECLGDYRERS